MAVFMQTVLPHAALTSEFTNYVIFYSHYLQSLFATPESQEQQKHCKQEEYGNSN